MSVRGSMPPHGRGRGRGTGKTMDWSWELYTPSPAVYASLWYPRRAPAIVTPYPPTECPVPHAQTRILDRRQTEGDFNRNFYIVEIVPDNEVDNQPNKAPEKIEVDSSRILDFVSPSELERFENDMFRAEAEVQAVAERAEDENRIRKRMERNARAGKGTVMNGMGLGRGVKTKGRPWGWGGGRGSGRGIGNGRSVVVAGQPQDDGLKLDEVLAPVEALRRDSEDVQFRVTMPPAAHTSPRTLVGHPEVPDISDSESDSNADVDAAMQLRLENDLREQLRIENSDDGSHRSKRRRTESAAPKTIRAHNPQHVYSQPALATDQPSQAAMSTSASVSEQSDQSMSSQPPSASSPHPINNAMIIGSKPSHISPSSHRRQTLRYESTEPVGNEQEDDNEDDEEEEYVVEAIHEHYHDGTQNMYLVKWEGYEDSFDWLPEDHLSGAAELVAEYHEEFKKRAQKGKGRV